MTEEVKTTEPQAQDYSDLASMIVDGLNSTMAESMIKAMQAYADSQQPKAKGAFTVSDALDELDETVALALGEPERARTDLATALAGLDGASAPPNVTLFSPLKDPIYRKAGDQILKGAMDANDLTSSLSNLRPISRLTA